MLFYYRYLCLMLSVVLLMLEFFVQRHIASPAQRAHHVDQSIQTDLRFTGDSTTPPSEVRHIGFVKVHKAASSTAQNIFFRFGLNRNLTFVFTQHNNYFSRESGHHYPLTKPKNRTGYDIHCIHGTFNHTLYSSLLPEDTVYLAIVRDPLQVFLSAVNYYTQATLHLPYLMKITGNKVQRLIRQPEAYDQEFYSYSKNVMGRDLGFPETLNQTTIDTYLEGLDKELKLVLIVEHFDESLILMKRYLNWSLRDILYISNNVLPKAMWSLANLTTSDIDLFQKRNKLDITVYDFFYKKFWKQLSNEGDGIVSELLNFRLVLNKVFTFCKGDNSQRKDTGETTNLLIIAESIWNPEFALTEEDCTQMRMAELEFIKLLRKEQGSEVPERPTLRSNRKGHGVEAGPKHKLDIKKHESESDQKFPSKKNGRKVDDKKKLVEDGKKGRLNNAT